MDNILFLTFILSLIALIVGLINPRFILRWESEKLSKFGLRKAIAVIFVSSAFLSVMSASVIKATQVASRQGKVAQPSQEENLTRVVSPVVESKPAKVSVATSSHEAPLKFVILQELKSRTDVFVDIDPTTEKLKTLIKDLSESKCYMKEICVINIYDDKTAYSQLMDINGPIFDDGYPEAQFNKIEAHFIGQYSKWPTFTTRRYRVDGQWVNF